MITVRRSLIVVICLAVLTSRQGSAGPVDTKRIPTPTLEALQSQFLMGEVLTLIRVSIDRTSSQAYLHSQLERFKFLATQQQQPMTVDGYTVLDSTSPIIGYSLFYRDSNGPLLIVDASVNPLQRTAVSNASDLIAKSFDSVSTPDGSRLYFLGIYDLDASRVIKIMVREAHTPSRRDYAIRYAVSGR